MCVCLRVRLSVHSSLRWLIRETVRKRMYLLIEKRDPLTIQGLPRRLHRAGIAAVVDGVAATKGVSGLRRRHQDLRRQISRNEGGSAADQQRPLHYRQGKGEISGLILVEWSKQCSCWTVALVVVAFVRTNISCTIKWC